MRTIVVHPEVEALLAKMGQGDPLKSVDVASIDCVVCGKRETLDEDGPALAMILETAQKRGQQMVRLQFAHEQCAPSELKQGHPDEMEPGLGALAVVFMIRSGVASLAFAPRIPALATKDGDWQDLWTEHFVAAGFVRTNVSVDLKPLDGWTLEISTDGIAVVGPDHDLHEFDAVDDQAWYDAVAQRPICYVITGSLELADFESERFHNALDEGHGVVALLNVIDRR